MINPSKVIQTPDGTYFEGVCLSTDVKPIAGYANGCLLTELNLSSGAVKTYRLDAANSQWVEVVDSDNELPTAPTDVGTYCLQLAVTSEGATKFWEALVSELPEIPDTDGEYTLLLTVTEGEPVLTWEAEET